MSNPEHSEGYTQDIDTFRSCLERAMGSCTLLLRLGGCRWGRSLCDDEIGVETECPGQIMRRYIRSGISDDAFSGHHVFFERPVESAGIEDNFEID